MEPLVPWVRYSHGSPMPGIEMMPPPLNAAISEQVIVFCTICPIWPRLMVVLKVVLSSQREPWPNSRMRGHVAGGGGGRSGGQLGGISGGGNLGKGGGRGAGGGGGSGSGTTGGTGGADGGHMEQLNGHLCRTMTIVLHMEGAAVAQV